MGIRPLTTKNVKTYSLKKRKSKVTLKNVSRLPRCGDSFSGFYSSLPDVLGAASLKGVVKAVVEAHKSKKTVILGMGAHVIKTGLSPLIIKLMERGIVNAVALNGACIVHDFELAYMGTTSEDVDKELRSGKFGMAEETSRMLNIAINTGVKKGFGLGRSVGEMINAKKLPHCELSILAAGARLDIPVTVHVAIGTDIIHMHPSMDAAMTGLGTHRDFLLFAGAVQTLSKGVYLNIGSAVIMPEVFLKALTLSRNLGGGEKAVKGFTTVDLDFIKHYRTITNVVNRPTQGTGKGYHVTGHHEILLPLLYAAITEELG